MVQPWQVARAPERVETGRSASTTTPVVSSQTLRPLYQALEGEPDIEPDAVVAKNRLIGDRLIGAAQGSLP